MPPDLDLAVGVDEAVEEDEQEEQIELEGCEPTVVVPPADVAEAAISRIEQNLDEYGCYVHEDQEDMLNHTVAQHQDMLREHGGFFYHVPYELEHVGYTVDQKTIIQRGLTNISSALLADIIVNDEGSVFQWNPGVYDSRGACLTRRIHFNLESKYGETVFAEADEDTGVDLGASNGNKNRHKKEVLLQLGMWCRKLDIIESRQVAKNLVGGDTGRMIEEQMRHCAYIKKRKLCACELCTERVERAHDRVGAQWREGQPINRPIMTALKKANIAGRTLARVQDSLAAVAEVWAGSKRKLRMTISCDPGTMLTLGEYGIVKGDGSCYRNGSEWSIAKHFLMRIPGGCAFYWYKAEDFDESLSPWEPQSAKPMARAWGIYQPQGLLLCSNFYGLPRVELQAALNLFVHEQFGDEMCDKAASPAKDGARVALDVFAMYGYLNKDAILYATENSYVTDLIASASEQKNVVGSYRSLQSLQKGVRRDHYYATHGHQGPY